MPAASKWVRMAADETSVHRRRADGVDVDTAALEVVGDAAHQAGHSVLRHDIAQVLGQGSQRCPRCGDQDVAAPGSFEQSDGCSDPVEHPVLVDSDDPLIGIVVKFGDVAEPLSNTGVEVHHIESTRVGFEFFGQQCPLSRIGHIQMAVADTGICGEALACGIVDVSCDDRGSMSCIAGRAGRTDSRCGPGDEHHSA